MIQLTPKFVFWFIALICFAVSSLGSRAWYGPASTYGWAGYGLVSAGLFFFTLGEMVG